jgi:hypothetical protein
VLHDDFAALRDEVIVSTKAAYDCVARTVGGVARA